MKSGSSRTLWRYSFVMATCEKCKVGSMAPAAVQRAGGFLLALAVLVGLAGAFMVLTMFFAMSHPPGSGRDGAVGLALIFSVGLWVIAAGLLSASRRKVWRCDGCGYFYDRA